MGDLIERGALLAQFNPDEDRIDPIEARYRIVTMPKVDAAPVVHARWIQKAKHSRGLEDWDETPYVECSVCGRKEWDVDLEDGEIDLPYCHCGARMDADAPERGEEGRE